jgi:stage II sporulation protein GA (sporulation sigma-E factor processing peptidase)
VNQYIVYADILLALNFFCDFFLLWTSGRILRRRINLLRISLAAIAGALYGLVVIFPACAWMAHPFCLFVISLILLRIAYAWDEPRSFLRLAGVFYLTAFAMAGAALAGERLLEQNGIILAPMQTLKAGSLFFAIFIAIILGQRGWATLRRNWHKDDFRLNIEIKVAGHSCRMSALLDTGNDLREPISGLPVLVADYQALRPLLPEYLRSAIENSANHDPTLILRELFEKGKTAWLKKLRLVPFTSIGEQNGLLLGFRPDMLIFEGAGKKQTNQAIICIYPKNLGNGYQAIVNPEIINGGEKFKEAS